jgi:anthranilate phosphoribosyltransferase
MPNTHKITPQEALLRTIEHREIFHDEMLHIVRQIMSGEWSPVMIAAFITGLRVKKETIGEITAAALAADASPPVLADLGTRSGRYKHGTGGDIEGVRAIATSAHNVDQMGLISHMDLG